MNLKYFSPLDVRKGSSYCLKIDVECENHTDNIKIEVVVNLLF